MHFNAGKYFFIDGKDNFYKFFKSVFVPVQQKGKFPALPVNFETKEKSRQAPIFFFFTSSCSNKLVEYFYFVDIIQLVYLTG